MNINPIIRVDQLYGHEILLGVFTTFNANSVTFDFAPMVKQHGAGVFAVSFLRPGETTPYSVANLETNGTLATWTFSATDTEKPGKGKAFLSYTVGNTVFDMSEDIPCKIAKNSAPTGEAPPAPLDTWYQQMLEAAADAQTSAQNAEASADTAAASESTVEGYKNAAEAAAQYAAAAQALAEQYAAAAALARQAAETAAAAAASAKTSAEAAQASAIAAAQAAAADKLAADASAAAAAASEQAALAAQAAAAASAAAAAGSEQSVADNAAAAIAARDAAAAAQNAAQAAQTAAASSAQAAATSATAAQNSASAAAQSAAQASAAATNAGASATLAESWAVGGTGTRTGEDTDNAQYYATAAATSATNAANSAAQIEQSAQKIDDLGEDVTALKTAVTSLENSDAWEELLAVTLEEDTSKISYIEETGNFNKRYKQLAIFVQLVGTVTIYPEIGFCGQGGVITAGWSQSFYGCQNGNYGAITSSASYQHAFLIDVLSTTPMTPVITRKINGAFGTSTYPSSVFGTSVTCIGNETIAGLTYGFAINAKTIQSAFPAGSTIKMYGVKRAK